MRNRSEQELAGYRDAQDYLFRQDWRPLNAGLILHLHRLLFAHTAMLGGAFKAEDNLVVDRSPDGSTTVRFKPVSAASTPFTIDDLIERYEHAVAAGEHHPVLLSGLFILDLLVIHPFEDGNGRVARLLTGAMLSEHGYTVGRYVSLEQAIAEFRGRLLPGAPGFHPRLARGRARPVALARLLRQRDRRRLRRLRRPRGRGPGPRDQAAARPRAHPAPRTGHVPPRRHQDGHCPVSATRPSGSPWEQLSNEGRLRADRTGRSATWTRTNYTATSRVSRDSASMPLTSLPEQAPGRR